MENESYWHGNVPNEEQLKQALHELGAEEPWPNSRCVKVTAGRWRNTGRSTPGCGAGCGYLRLPHCLNSSPRPNIPNDSSTSALPNPAWWTWRRLALGGLHPLYQRVCGAAGAACTGADPNLCCYARTNVKIAASYAGIIGFQGRPHALFHHRSSPICALCRT